MTDQELFKTLKKYVRQEEHFSTNILEVLKTYKNAGGKRKTAEKFIHKLSAAYQDDETINQRTLKIREIVTDWKKTKM
ncbi:hypothetical protein EG240_09535 [Paenimyroides tangerinum]|uniref:Uncharacterized protein n=1 Tax=Paenimyroides tangerinum TaxID=2488728 RepID=A0A3P3W4R5_9FLAO|nr:hypothetical protein [Paenimyroides tangerinum]RRJ90101.1 hypothetical protein EG240_09535 [Paenimyroides tangerinum]